MRGGRVLSLVPRLGALADEEERPSEERPDERGERPRRDIRNMVTLAALAIGLRTAKDRSLS